MYTYININKYIQKIQIYLQYVQPGTTEVILTVWDVFTIFQCSTSSFSNRLIQFPISMFSFQFSFVQLSRHYEQYYRTHVSTSISKVEAC